MFSDSSCPQPEKYPRTPYTVFMDKHRIHLFTVIQIFFFAALYAVKTIKTIAIAFPFFILLSIPARIYLLPRIFESHELIVLDGSPEEVENFVEQKAIEEMMVEEEEECSEEGEEGGDKPAPLATDLLLPVVAEGIINETVDSSTTAEEGHVGVLTPDHGYTPEMFEAAHRRSGRADRRRKKTVSDLSGMFRTPPETNWSHV